MQTTYKQLGYPDDWCLGGLALELKDNAHSCLAAALDEKYWSDEEWLDFWKHPTKALRLIVPYNNIVDKTDDWEVQKALHVALKDEDPDIGANPPKIFIRTPRDLVDFVLIKAGGRGLMAAGELSAADDDEFFRVGWWKSSANEAASSSSVASSSSASTVSAPSLLPQRERFDSPYLQLRRALIERYKNESKGKDADITLPIEPPSDWETFLPLVWFADTETMSSAVESPKKEDQLGMIRKQIGKIEKEFQAVFDRIRTRAMQRPFLQALLNALYHDTSAQWFFIYDPRSQRHFAPEARVIAYQTEDEIRNAYESFVKNRKKTTPGTLIKSLEEVKAVLGWKDPVPLLSSASNTEAKLGARSSIDDPSTIIAQHSRKKHTSSPIYPASPSSSSAPQSSAAASSSSSDKAKKQTPQGLHEGRYKPPASSPTPRRVRNPQAKLSKAFWTTVQPRNRVVRA